MWKVQVNQALIPKNTDYKWKQDLKEIVTFCIELSSKHS